MNGAQPTVAVEERALLRGFAPLVVAAALLLLSILLVPSVAPERVVVQPDDQATEATAP
jgi:hypothetical protein